MLNKSIADITKLTLECIERRLGKKIKELMINNIDYAPIVIKWVEYLIRGDENIERGMAKLPSA